MSGRRNRMMKDNIRAALRSIDPMEGVTCKHLKKLLGINRRAPIRDLVKDGTLEHVPGSGRKRYRLPQ